jgi:hypothetical protein
MISGHGVQASRPFFFEEETTERKKERESVRRVDRGVVV